MNKPNNWYSMSYEEQREYQKQQRAIEEAEWEARRAAENAEVEIRNAKKEYAAIAESERENYYQAAQELSATASVLAALRTINAELVAALQALCDYHEGDYETLPEILAARVAIEKARKDDDE